MSYDFYVGESIRSSILNTLSPLFSSLSVSTLPLEELTKHGDVLDVALKSHNFKISTFRAHIMKLTIEYKGYDEDGKNIFTVLTETSGASNEGFSNRRTGVDVRRFPIYYEATESVLGIGNAYDVALSKSLAKLIETWISPGFITVQASGPERAEFDLPINKEIKNVGEFTLVKNKVYLNRFVFEGKSPDDWTEALDVINSWRRDSPKTPEGLYNSSRDSRIKNCPESTFDIIDTNPKSIFWETKTVNCTPHPDENSLTRILYGKKQVFTLIYTNKIKDIPKETRDEWMKILSKAKVK